jgi:hypothetical protein
VLAGSDLNVGSGKLLLGFANTVILDSESRLNHDHILLSHGSGSRVTPVRGKRARKFMYYFKGSQYRKI